MKNEGHDMYLSASITYKNTLGKKFDTEKYKYFPVCDYQWTETMSNDKAYFTFSDFLWI